MFYENDWDFIIVIIFKVNFYNLGVLIVFYEWVVGFYGFLVNINVYY